MAGAVIIVVVLLLFPVLVGAGCFLIAALLGWVLNEDGEQRAEGSELVELNR